MTGASDAADVVVRVATDHDARAYLDFAVRNRDFLAPFEPLRAEHAYSIDAMRERCTPSATDVPLVALDVDGQIVGQVRLSNIVRAPVFLSCTVGYAVDEHHQGWGIATRMVTAAVDHAFAVLGLHRVEAGTLLHNTASQRVLEKCGFHRIGISPRHVCIAGRWQDHLLFSITREDWT